MTLARHPRHRGLVAALGAGVLLASLAACGSDVSTGDDATGASGSQSITVYSGQHEDLAKALAAAFTKQSGIDVQVRAGSDVELANQIREEGDKSRADVFLTEEPGPVAAVAKDGQLSPLEQSTLDRVPEEFRATDGAWVGVSARARVLQYNPDLIKEGELPTSLLDLSDPKWKGKFGYAPSGAFQGTVTYLRTTIGEEKTEQWLRGILANGVNLKKNGAVRDAVEAGQVPFGLLNHYYYVLKEREVGQGKMVSKLHNFGNGDAGSLVFASGAGVLKSSSKQDAAQQFVAFLVDPEGGQKVIAETTPQYPVAIGAPANPELTPLADIGAPKIDQSTLADTEGTKQLLAKVGML
jgi:iron(III) transport system substrate-binding protein